MRELYRSDLLTVRVDAARVVHYVRSSVDSSAVPADMLAALRAIDTLDRREHALFVDVRLAPFNNEPGFEAAVRPILDRLYVDFVAIAVLTKSALGRMQVKRQAVEIGRAPRFFQDEAAALAHLRDALATAPSPSSDAKRPADGSTPPSSKRSRL